MTASEAASSTGPDHDSSPPANWQESISQLSSSLSSDDSKANNAKIEKACAAILERDQSSAADNNSSGDGEQQHHSLPDSVRETVTTIHLRSLIKLGKYDAAVEHCGQHENVNVEEHAYSLYRLRKYEACRKLCSSAKDNANNVSRGVMHTYAQALYRLGETNKADEIYHQLLTSNEGTENDPAMDIDEREDALSNALANRSANYTPGSLLGAETKSWLEEDDALQQLLTSYGDSSSSEEMEGDMLQNYDLAYNLATYLLLSAESRDQSEILRVKQLLEHAEASALTILESSSAPPTELEGEEKLKKQRQQQQLAEREAGPIRANLALAKLLLGGEANETEALRGYLTLVTKAAMAKNKGKGGGVEANLLATASNNLALLRDGKESLFDVMKRIPTTSSLSVSEDGVGAKSGKGGKEKGATSTQASTVVPLVGATPQQARVALFNRALLFAKMANVAGCLEVLNVLRASLLVSYHGDDDPDGKAKNEVAVSGSSQKKSKGKKKKGGAAATTSADGANKVLDVPTAKPPSEVETIAWNARADWLESEVYRISESKEKSSEEILNNAISKLDKASKAAKNDNAYGAVPFSKSQLLLHRAAVINMQHPKGAKDAVLIEAMESLPPSVQSCPGATITKAQLYASHETKSEELLSSLGDDIRAKLAMAEFQMRKGQYEKAVQLLTGIVEEEEDNIEATALLVKALSYTDPSKAEEYIGLLQEAMMGDEKGPELDGEALESMDIPRFAKKAMGAHDGAGSSSKVRKMIEQTGGKGRSNMGERSKKKNREAILRKRAKQRDTYLSRLESEGRYDPIKKQNPDPERWIPKSQRSSNRRGRGGGRNRYGNKSNVGAQGGGAGAGMEKDAAKLDVAARVAAAKAGVGGAGDAKPSTANIKVTSSGTTRKGKGSRRR